MLEQVGLEVTLVAAGEFKTEANPFQALSDEGHAHAQSVVNDIYHEFVGDVAGYRRKSVGFVESHFGKGRLVRAEMALAAGMVDRVEPFDLTVSRLLNPITSTTRTKSLRARLATAAAWDPDFDA